MSNTDPGTIFPSHDFNTCDSVECIPLHPAQSAKDIIWSSNIPQHVLHHGAYFFSNLTAMGLAWEHPTSICYSGHRDTVGGPPFPLVVLEFFSAELTAVWVLVNLLLGGAVWKALKLVWMMCKRALEWWKKTRTEKRAREEKLQMNED